MLQVFLLCAGAVVIARSQRVPPSSAGPMINYATKQSILPVLLDGLLRYARNDEKTLILFRFATLVTAQLKLRNESRTKRARIADSCPLPLRSPQHLAWVARSWH